MGKILGMAMAYAVSALGLLLAYYNYRKRVVRAERVMSSTAWTVVVIIFLVIGAGGWTVHRLAGKAAAAAISEEQPTEVAAASEETAPIAEEAPQEGMPRRITDRWPWVGIAIPAAIFLFATWVTAALHHHFAIRVHGGTPGEDRVEKE